MHNGRKREIGTKARRGNRTNQKIVRTRTTERGKNLARQTAAGGCIDFMQREGGGIHLQKGWP